MAQFILAYHDQRTPEDPQGHMGKWMEWITGLGDAVVNPGTPLGKSTFVNSEGVSENGVEPMSGFTIVNADSQQAAVEMAKASPYLAMGTIEVAEIKQMK